MTLARPFHAAYPVSDIDLIKSFYVEILGCVLGRSGKTWVDLNFFGHQLVFHLDKSYIKAKSIRMLDSKEVPVPHFGVILAWDDFDALIEQVKSANIKFVIEPHTRFYGKPGEQKTCFFQDPNGLYLEFKTFKKDSMIFET